MSRLAKQLLIGGIYLALMASMLWLGYRWLVPAPTCTDGVQNGAEEGRDCGVNACGMLCPVAVAPLRIDEVKLLAAGSGYDALLHFENPNQLYGASRVDYVLTIFGAEDEVLATRRDSTYVNPAQPRYVLHPLVGLSSTPVRAELRVDPAAVVWGALSVDAKGDIQFAVRNEQFAPASASARFEATVLNRSKFTFDTVDVTVLVFDDHNAIVSANSTIQRTLVAGEDRGFVMEWPFGISGAYRAQTIVTTNIFANDNFLRTYGSQEPFQQF